MAAQLIQYLLLVLTGIHNTQQLGDVVLIMGSFLENEADSGKCTSGKYCLLLNQSVILALDHVKFTFNAVYHYRSLFIVIKRLFQSELRHRIRRCFIQLFYDLYLTFLIII